MNIVIYCKQIFLLKIVNLLLTGDRKNSYSSHCFRWAQFFIHPLMVWDAIDREVEAVDSGKSNMIS